MKYIVNGPLGIIGWDYYIFASSMEYFQRMRKLDNITELNLIAPNRANPYSEISETIECCLIEVDNRAVSLKKSDFLYASDDIFSYNGKYYGIIVDIGDKRVCIVFNELTFRKMQNKTINDSEDDNYVYESKDSLNKTENVFFNRNSENIDRNNDNKYSSVVDGAVIQWDAYLYISNYLDLYKIVNINDIKELGENVSHNLNRRNSGVSFTLLLDSMKKQVDKSISETDIDFVMENIEYSNDISYGIIKDFSGKKICILISRDTFLEYYEYKNKKEESSEKESHQSKEKDKPETNKKPIKSIILILCIVLIFGFMVKSCVNKREKKDTETIKDLQTTPSPTPTPVPTPTPLPEEPLPENGYIIKNTDAECIAPFKVDAMFSSSNSLIYLQSTTDSSKDMCVFVRKGDMINISVPLGDYKVLTCSGDKWYGKDYKFGENSNFSEMDTILHFEKNQFNVSGNSLTLRSLTGGNVSSSDISEDKFPDL